MAADINAFFSAILHSALIDQMAEYSVAGFKIGYGQLAGSKTVANLAVPSTVTDEWIRSTLTELTKPGGDFPQPTPNSVYFVYLPPGTTLTMGGSNSCQAFCGYHDHIDGKLFYAAMPYPNCAGCLGSLSALDALTSTSSHELCEAITDPIPGMGWYDDANGEIGDICAWQTRKLGAYTVQLEWSNKRNSCM
jgi:hypothetical protein